MVIPMSGQAASQYTALRANLAVKNPLALGSTGYGLHPNMTALASLYSRGNVALKFNVGTLVTPLDTQPISEWLGQSSLQSVLAFRPAARMANGRAAGKSDHRLGRPRGRSVPTRQRPELRHWHFSHRQQHTLGGPDPRSRRPSAAMASACWAKMARRPPPRAMPRCNRFSNSIAALLWYRHREAFCKARSKWRRWSRTPSAPQRCR